MTPEQQARLWEIEARWKQNVGPIYGGSVSPNQFIQFSTNDILFLLGLISALQWEVDSVRRGYETLQEAYEASESKLADQQAEIERMTGILTAETNAANTYAKKAIRSGNDLDDQSALVAQYREALREIGELNATLTSIAEKAIASPASVSALERKRAERDALNTIVDMGGVSGELAYKPEDFKKVALAALDGQKEKT